jgi:hypothetical protein
MAQKKAQAEVDAGAFQFHKKLVLDIRFVTVGIDVVLPTTRASVGVVRGATGVGVSR